MRLRDLALIAAALFAGGEAAAAPSVALTWEPMPGALGYELEVAAAPDFATPIVSATSETPRYEWRTLPERVYYWRVRCQYSFGRRGEWSSVRAIPRAVYPVTLASPKPDEEIVCDGCRVRLSFLRSPALGSYRVELTREADSDFLVPLVDERVTSAVDSVEWTPEDTGAYLWRVSAVDLLGRPVPPAAASRVVIRPPVVTVAAAPSPVPTVVAGPPISDLAMLLETSIAESMSSVAPASISAIRAPEHPAAVAPAPEAAAPAAPAPARRSVMREPPEIAAGGGWRSNFLRVSDVTPVVTATQHLRGDFSAAVTVSSFRASAPDAHADVAEAALQAGAGRWLGPGEITFRAGPVLQIVRARVGDASEIGATAAFGGGVEITGPLSGARWFLAADVRHGHWNGRYTELSTGGALFSAGVRFR